jgi:hypothetical protein
MDSVGVIWPVVRKVEVRETGARRSRQVDKVEWRMFIVDLDCVLIFV